MQTDSPIFITGIPRSGSTFMQHLLSRHPRITIYGQEPNRIPWGSWLNSLVKAAEFAATSNAQLNYEVPHYAGMMSRQQTAASFLNFVRTFLCGDEQPPRWGLKSFTQSRIAAPMLQQVWPQTRWIVTLRDPFRSIESLRNTYDTRKLVPIDVLCRWWTEAVRFAQAEPNARLVIFDRLTTPEIRHRTVAELFEFIGEPLTDEVRRYVDEWPVIHKVVPDDERKYVLTPPEREELLAASPAFAAAVRELEFV